MSFLFYIQYVRESFFQTLTSQEVTLSLCLLPLLNTVRLCAQLIRAAPTSLITGSCLCFRQRLI